MGLMCAVLAIDFTRSGHFELGDGSLRTMGYYGIYWSRTVFTDSNNVYYFDFGPVTLKLSNYRTRDLSFPTRCLASYSP